MWFADKLGPVPKNSPLGKAEPQSTKSHAAARNAPQAKSQPSRSQPAPESEPPKKKKGWF